MDGATEVQIGTSDGNESARPSFGRRCGELKWAVADAFEAEIRRYAKAGYPFPSLQALADSKGISISTASRALWLLGAAKRVERQCRGSDYRYRVLPDGDWTAWRISSATLPSEGATLVQEASGPIAGLTGHVEVNGKAAVEGSTKFLGPTCEGKPVAWADLTLAGTVAVTGKVTTPRSAHAPDDPRYTKDFLAMLRDRRETLKIQRVRIDLAIEHMDGLLHILAPESDTSEVENKA